MLASVGARGRVSRDVLALLVSTPGQELHTREIARRVDADPHAVQRALEQLIDAGLLQSRRLGNLRLWSATRSSPLLPAVRDLVRRTTGAAQRLRQALEKMPNVQLAFLFGSYASGRDRLGSDIDLFLVGLVDWQRLSTVTRQVGSALGREINTVVWTLEDLGRPTPTQQRFLKDLLRKPRIWLIGDDSELERVRSSVGAAVGASSRTRSPKPGRGSV